MTQVEDHNGLAAYQQTYTRIQRALDQFHYYCMQQDVPRHTLDLINQAALRFEHAVLGLESMLRQERIGMQQEQLAVPVKHAMHGITAEELGIAALATLASGGYSPEFVVEMLKQQTLKSYGDDGVSLQTYIERLIQHSPAQQQGDENGQTVLGYAGQIIDCLYLTATLQGIEIPLDDWQAAHHFAMQAQAEQGEPVIDMGWMRGQTALMDCQNALQVLQLVGQMEGIDIATAVSANVPQDIQLAELVEHSDAMVEARLARSSAG